MIINKSDLRIGDIILVSGSTWFERLIQWATKCKWDHAAIVAQIDEDPSTVKIGQALTSGFQISRVEFDWIKRNCLIIRPALQTEATDEQVQVEILKLVGEKYDFLDLIRIFIRLKFNISIGEDVPDGEVICSEAVAQIYKKFGGFNISPYPPCETSPADIYNTAKTCGWIVGGQL